MPPFKEFFERKCVLIVLVVSIICATVIGIVYIHRPQPPTKEPISNPLQAPMIQLNGTEILKCIEDAGFKKSTKYNYYTHIATCRDLAQLTNSLLERGKELPEWSKVDKRKELLIADYEWKKPALLMLKITSASEYLCQGCPGSTKQSIVASTVGAPSQPTTKNQPESTTTMSPQAPWQPTTKNQTESTTTMSPQAPSQPTTKKQTGITTTMSPQPTPTTVSKKINMPTAPSEENVNPAKITTSTTAVLATSPPPKPRTASEIVDYLNKTRFKRTPDETYYVHESTCHDLSELYNWLTQEKEEIPPWARFTQQKEVRISYAQTTDALLLVDKIKTVRDSVCQNSSDILIRLSKHKFEKRGKHLYEARLNCSDFSELWKDSYASKSISFSSNIHDETWMVLHKLELLNRSQLTETLEWVSGKLCQPLPDTIWPILKQEGVEVLSEGVVNLDPKDCTKLAKLIDTIPKKTSEMIPAYVQENFVKLVQKLKTAHAQNCMPDLNTTDVLEIFKTFNFTKPAGHTWYSYNASCHDLATVLNKLKKEYGELPEWSDVKTKIQISADDYEYPKLSLLIAELEKESLIYCQNETSFWQHLTKSGFNPAEHDTYEADVTCENLAKLLQRGDRTSGDLPDWSKVDTATRMSILKLETSNKTRLMRKLRWMSYELCKPLVTPVDNKKALEDANFTSDDDITYSNDNASCETLGKLTTVLRNSNESLPEWSKIRKSHRIVVQNRTWSQRDLLIEYIEATAKRICTIGPNFWEILYEAGFTDEGSLFKANLTCADFNKLFEELKEQKIEISEEVNQIEPKLAVLYKSQWMIEIEARNQLKSMANDLCKAPSQPTTKNLTGSTRTTTPQAPSQSTTENGTKSSTIMSSQ